MDIQAKKLSLIEQLMHIRKASTLQRFEELLAQAKKDEQKQEPMSIEEYNTRIDKAEKQVALGHFTTQEDLEKQAKKW